MQGASVDIGNTRQNYFLIMEWIRSGHVGLMQYASRGALAGD